MRVNKRRRLPKKVIKFEQGSKSRHKPDIDDVISVGGNEHEHLEHSQTPLQMFITSLMNEIEFIAQCNINKRTMN